ncbi:acetyl-CoA carboxylase carboxyltransferase subunit alpha [Hoeflea prorocentri]|uniref:Acetyl-coenzyme A carboxylase carboxyl transferase subunit alpha n=1 Tax=Hoeflea prorocentri TaxID=1922333 RepID=A0A9X3UME4_9HYPH|nr:acetyl-CoA carboxylase carboxyltransferase subunit alpha [Hoeflea prorocentri]MCY6383530.1 acetyl-CoA carboxylase carboxyltransferase subunit alpha [Hoeflea prorocentri]MDA5401330.1 acetyl-CoA carboxylase carboxyltransferase subunit alpha [Hoeflea prorocentri]
MINYLDFEKPLSDIEGKIHELRRLAGDDEIIDTAAEIEKLEARAKDVLADLYTKLTPWQKTQVARHPARPHFRDYAEALFEEFTPLAGDRKFSNDEAIQAGLGRFRGQGVAIIGQEKGNDTKSRIRHNFGSARPEGYRKAVRVLEMANRFGLPVITLIDTSGAYPGVGAEERGQAEAIARSTEMCLNVKVPIISVVIGEGGSGGAIAIATGNRIYMLEHAIYSVISPEGAASILWRDAARAKDAAANMKITAQDLKQLGVIDDIIEEPVGGAHRDPAAVIAATGDAIAGGLDDLSSLDGDMLRRNRRQKFLDMGRNL